MGISTSEVTKDYAALMDRQSRLIDFMRQGVESTLRKKSIEIIRGKRTVWLAKGKSTSMAHPSPANPSFWPQVQAGSERSFPGADLEDVVNSDYLLGEKRLPARVLLYGRSPWLVEIAQFLHRYGVKAILATPEKRILPHENKTIAVRLAKGLKNEGMEIRTGFEISCRSPGESDGIHIESNSGKIVADKLVTFERRASLEGLGLEACRAQRRQGIHRRQ